jgi:uncharacterized protein YajQ (UPF0234 family)
VYALPSFDVVSKVDLHEMQNAVDQTAREIASRFDFKGSDAKIERSDTVLTIGADNDFQIKQILDILYNKMSKRQIDLACLDAGEPSKSGKTATLKINIKQGVDKDTGKKIVKLVKESKLKTQASIQGEQVRVTGKKRDDLQQLIQLIKQQDLGLPLQYINFRD